MTEDLQALETAKEGALRLVAGSIRGEKGVTANYVATHLRMPRMLGKLLAQVQHVFDETENPFCPYAPLATQALEGLLRDGAISQIGKGAHPHYWLTKKGSAMIHRMNEGMRYNEALEDTYVLAQAQLDVPPQSQQPPVLPDGVNGEKKVTLTQVNEALIHILPPGSPKRGQILSALSQDTGRKRA